jgi:fructose transport system permease protein
VGSDGDAPGRASARFVPWAQLGPFLALVLACAFFAVAADRFFSGQNLSLILQQVTVVGVIAIAQTLVILTAGIDLSCGMIMALGGISRRLTCRRRSRARPSSRTSPFAVL